MIVGRPKRAFEDCSMNTKRKKVSALRKGEDTSSLSLAIEMNLRAEGKVAEAKIIKEMLHDSPGCASRMVKDRKSSNDELIPYSPTDALALIIDADLSRRGYQVLRKQAMKRNSNLYPSYKLIQKAKQECYPTKTTVSERKAETDLQSMMDITTERIFKVLNGDLPVSAQIKYTLISKWGFDGSGSQSAYNQTFASEAFNDTSLLMTSFVPLQLFYTVPGKSDRHILWQNPRPSSVRFCRPLKLEFIKETSEVILQEEEYWSNAISKLLPSRVGEISVVHDLALSMIDGKVHSVLTNTKSTQMCVVCKATPRDMNDIDQVSKRKCDSKALELGISILHAYIRFFEWLLHVSYRLELKCYFKNKNNRDSIEKRAVSIRQKFRKEYGIIVDGVKPGFGTTNTGNTARKFFENPKKTSEITGLNEELIDRCDTILRVISSGYPIDVTAFKKYALDTARLYVRFYEWYPMPASVHKILLHGSQAIEIAVLPIGMLSEEAQESRNKDFRKFRTSKSRKTSRKDNLQDVFNQMILTSDPVLTNKCELPNPKENGLKKSVMELLEMTPMDTESDNDD